MRRAGGCHAVDPEGGRIIMIRAVDTVAMAFGARAALGARLGPVSKAS